jgi:hypothetical protein
MSTGNWAYSMLAVIIYISKSILCQILMTLDGRYTRTTFLSKNGIGKDLVNLNTGLGCFGFWFKSRCNFSQDRVGLRTIN